MKSFLAPLLLISHMAFGSLGGTVSSVESDRAHLKGAARMVAGDAYTMHEITAPTGTQVREFVSPNGLVFGVAWDGPALPDMRQVLGDYFSEYKQAAEEQKNRRRGPLLIETPHMVFQLSGHPRSFHGRAYLPQDMPQGVKADAVR
ncbi:MAG: DUF2844 domain-containing protein [Acidobacteriaceae bacterium]